jgi:hypothetical protein
MSVIQIDGVDIEFTVCPKERLPDGADALLSVVHLGHQLIVVQRPRVGWEASLKRVDRLDQRAHILPGAWGTFEEAARRGIEAVKERGGEWRS